MIEQVNFYNLNEGELVKRFAKELGKVLEDIDNPDKENEAKRTIVLEVEITPDAALESASVLIKSKVKLPAANPSLGLIKLEEGPRGIQATAIVDKQTPLFIEEAES